MQKSPDNKEAGVMRRSQKHGFLVAGLLGAALILGALPAPAAEIVHDAEYYILVSVILCLGWTIAVGPAAASEYREKAKLTPFASAARRVACPAGEYSSRERHHAAANSTVNRPAFEQLNTSGLRVRG
jgi:hypothetical protein